MAESERDKIRRIEKEWRGDKPCCPMVAAVRSIKRGKFRLAGRYAAMSLRLMAARVV